MRKEKCKMCGGQEWCCGEGCTGEPPISKEELESARLDIKIGEHIVKKEITEPRRRKIILFSILIIVILVLVIIVF